jgi:hypothetical protein
LYDELLVRFEVVMKLGHGASSLMFVGVRVKGFLRGRGEIDFTDMKN